MYECARARSLNEEATPVQTCVARTFGRSPSSVAPVCECARVYSLSPTRVPEAREREKNWRNDVFPDRRAARLSTTRRRSSLECSSAYRHQFRYIVNIVRVFYITPYVRYRTVYNRGSRSWFFTGIRIPDHSASKSKLNVGRRWAFGRAVVAAAAPAAAAAAPEITVIRLTHRRPSTRLAPQPAVVGLTLTGLRTLRRRAD